MDKPYDPKEDGLREDEISFLVLLREMKKPSWQRNLSPFQRKRQADALRFARRAERSGNYIILR